jgi:REP element-mobilizing transposase RayT
MKFTTTPLVPGMYYHIYNRGNNRENLFLEKRNYPYFLSLYAKHIEPIADTFAYCLMRNHLHVSLRIKTEEEWRKTSQVLEICEVSSSKPKKFNPSQAFSNLFNAYAKAINKGYGRTGSLFEERFGRIPVTNDSYFANLIFYIHYNPQKHGFVGDFRDWEWSSYHALIGTGETKLKRDEVLSMFNGRKGFEEFHQGMVDEKKLALLIDEEFELEAQYPANLPREAGK